MEPEMIDNPLQAIVDAELLKFTEAWSKDHPQVIIDLDAELPPPAMGMGASSGFAEARIKSLDRYLAGKRAYRDEYRTEKKAYIRTNRLIQECLRVELEVKAEAARQNLTRAAYFMLLANRAAQLKANSPQ